MPGITRTRLREPFRLQAADPFTILVGLGILAS